jgi:hypothetical protein
MEGYDSGGVEPSDLLQDLGSVMHSRCAGPFIGVGGAYSLKEYLKACAMVLVYDVHLYTNRSCDGLQLHKSMGGGDLDKVWEQIS